MREIKFRAKGESGKWQYSEQPHDFWYGLDDGQLDRETLGQYTGLKDKNGKEIYEGDVVKWKMSPLFGEGETYIKPVEWSSDGQMIFPANLNQTEVIGNIYENPELL